MSSNLQNLRQKCLKNNFKQNLPYKNKSQMSKASKSPNANQSFLSTVPNPLPSAKKQFPSITLSKHLEQYKAYRSIDNRKKFHDIDKSTTFNISPEEKSILLLRNGDMPSIHNANQINVQDGLIPQSKSQKLQMKILKNLTSSKKEQQWLLYITKSQLIQQKSQQFQEIQQYLLKVISKNMDRTWNSSPLNDEENLFQQNSYLANAEVQNKKLNQNFTSSMLQNGKDMNKKSCQPSLRILKDQMNGFNNSRDYSGLQTPSLNGTNKTSINFNQSKDKSVIVTRIQQKHAEQTNKMTFERSLLQKKLQLYEKRIQALQASLSSCNIPIQSQYGSEGNEHNFQNPKNKKMHNTDQLMVSNLINQNKYKSQAEFKKIQNQTLIHELNIIKEFSFKLKGQNQRLLDKIQSLERQCQQCRQFKKYKELWLMQYEEMIGWKNLCRERKEENQKLSNKIKIIKEKNKQLLHSFNFSMVVNPDQEEDKQELDNIIKGFQQWLKVISVPRVNCAYIDPKDLMQSQCIKEQQYMPDPDNVNYKLLKPNFFIFFEAYEKTIIMEKNILNTRPLDQTFFVKIRVILDSIYNHFNSFGCYKYWTSFPEFVMGFLQKYEINFTSLKMQSRNKPMSSEQKLTFLMNLFNKKLSNTWECELFRSFILEEYTLDEIYFFLDCRNDLNGGSALTHGLGTMDPVSYVKIHKALTTAQRKLFPYQNHIIERVKTIIKSRKKQKNGESFIDRHFVLKLLLQVYSLEKIKSQRIFEASFKSKNSKKKTISYSDFYGFMSKNFEFLSSIDVCQLYRQTYALSSGKITYKGVHHVCSSKGLFIPLIWTKRLNMNVLDKSLNNDMMLLDLQNTARRMNSHLTALGVEQVGRLQNDLNYFSRQLDWYRNNRQVFYFKLQQIKMKIIKSNCLLDWQSSTYTPNEMLSTQEIRQGILQIHSLIHQGDGSSNLLSKKREQKQKALKQLTRNFKIRIQESMSQFKRVDQDQLNKLKQQVALEIKMRDMRMKGQQIERYHGQNLNKREKPLIGNNLANVSNLISIQRGKRGNNISSTQLSNTVSFKEGKKRSSILDMIEQNELV